MAQNNPFFGNPLDTVTDEIRARRYALPDFSEVRSTPDAAGTSPRPASGNGLLPPPEYEPLFVTAGQQYQVPINVLMALGQQESSYNPGAIGTMTKWGRAKGMMQYIDPTAEGMGIDPLDPAQAVDAAARQFQERLANGYSVEEAIMAHHGGDNRAEWGPKTRQYLKDVLGKAAAIRQQWRPPEARGVTRTAIRSAEQVAQGANETPVQGDMSKGPGDQAAREQVAALREQARDPNQVDAMTGADLKLNDPNAPKPQTPLDLIRRGLEGASAFLKTPASEIDILNRRAKGPADGLPGERPEGGLLGDVAGSIEAATRDPGAFTGERERDARPDAYTGADRKITEPDTTWTGWVTNLAKEVASGGTVSAASSIEGTGLIGQQMANVEAGRQLSRAARKFDGARQTLARTLKANQDQDPQTILERTQGHAERLARAEADFHRALVEEANREPDKIATWLREQGVDLAEVAQGLKADPEYAGVAADLASGVGSMLTYLGPGFLTTLMTRGSTAAIRGIAGIAGASALAGPAGAAEAYQRAKKHGLPEEEAIEIAMAGIPAGIVQVAPVAVILKKIPQGVRGKAVAQFRHLLESFGAEFTAEGAGAVMQNLVEKSYNPDKGTWDDSLYQAAIGGSSAALITLGVQLATRGRGIGPLDAGDLGRELDKTIAKAEWASTPEMEALRRLDPAEYLGRIRVQVEETAGPEATLDGDLGQPQGPAPEGPVERAAAETAAEEAVANVPGERVTVETRTGKLTGTVEDYFEDGEGGWQAQVLADDGEVYVFDQDSLAVIIRDEHLGEAPSTQAPEEGGETSPESSSPAPAETPPMAHQAPGEAAETPQAEPEDAPARRHAARADQRIAFLDIAESEQDVEDLIAAEMADPDLPASETSEARNRFLQAAGARAKALAGTSTASQAESATTDQEAVVAHEPAAGEPQAASTPAEETQTAPTGEPIVEHITHKGKRKRGVVRDVPKAEATAIDPYAFKKNGGWFINLKRLESAQEAPDATQEGQVPESDQREHQDREEGGQAAEAGRGDRPGHRPTEQEGQEAVAQQSKASKQDANSDLMFTDRGKPFASFEQAQRRIKSRNLKNAVPKQAEGGGWGISITPEGSPAQAPAADAITRENAEAQLAPARWRGDQAKTTQYVNALMERGLIEGTPQLSSARDAGDYPAMAEEIDRQLAGEAVRPATVDTVESPGSAAKRQRNQDRTPPIADARREDKKRQLRDQGRETALASEANEVPEWAAGDTELENAWTQGWNEGMVQRADQPAKAPAVEQPAEAKPQASDSVELTSSEAKESKRLAAQKRKAMDRGDGDAVDTLDEKQEALRQRINQRVEKEKPQASGNTIFTDDAAAAARERLRKRLGTLQSGIDPEMMLDGITLAGWHIEKGARTFAAYAKAMIEDLGPAAKPYLKSWYAGVYFDPRAETFDGMTDPGEIRGMDIDAILGETSAVPEVDKVGPVDRLKAIGTSAKQQGVTTKKAMENATEALEKLDHAIRTGGIDRMTGPTMSEIADALGLPKSGKVADRREHLKQWRAVNTDARLDEVAQVAAAYRKGELKAKDALEQGLITEYPQAFPAKVRAIARDTGGTGRYDWQKTFDEFVAADTQGLADDEVARRRDLALAAVGSTVKGKHERAIETAQAFGLEVPADVLASMEAARQEEASAPEEPSRDDQRRVRQARVKSVATAAVETDLREATGDERALLEDVKTTLQDPEADRSWPQARRAAAQRRRGQYVSEAFDVVKAAEQAPETAESTLTPAQQDAGRASQPAETEGERVGAQVTPEQFAALLDEAEATDDPRSPFVTPPTITRAAEDASQAGALSLEDAQDRVARWKAHARAQGESGVNSGKVVLSLFEVSGALTRPWVEAGYDVQTFDIQTGQDIKDFDVERLTQEVEGGLENVHAVLACPPCTDFAGSGAWKWKEKDADGRTEASKALVRQVLNTVELVRPPVWMIENPVGRLARMTGMPHPTLTFQPHHYGDPFTKKTLLWGDFNPHLPQANVDPTEGSRAHKLSGRDKDARSETPEGFAYAFFMANNAADMAPLDLLAGQFRGIDHGLLNDALAAGLTPERIKQIIEDDYHDGALEAAESLLRDATRMQAPEYQAERERLKQRQEEIRAGAESGDAHAQAWADLQFHYVERELREQESAARAKFDYQPPGNHLTPQARMEYRLGKIRAVSSGDISEQDLRFADMVRDDQAADTAATGEQDSTVAMAREFVRRKYNVQQANKAKARGEGRDESEANNGVDISFPEPEPRPTDEVLRPASRAPRWRTRKGAEKHRDQRDLLGIYVAEAEANGWILRRLPTFTLTVSEHRYESKTFGGEIGQTVLLRPEGMSLDLFKALAKDKLGVKPSQIIQNGSMVKARVDKIQRLADHLEAPVVDHRDPEASSQMPIRGGSTDDTQGDSAAGTQPLVDATPEGTVPAEPGTDPAPVDGIRPSRTDGDGQPDSDRSRRGDGVERGEVAGTESATQPGGTRGGDPAVGPGGGHRAPASDSLNRDEDRPHTLAGENPGNFVIPEDFKLGQGTTGQKIQDNLAALEVMLAANAEQRFATPAEQKILARYVGWGGLSQVFDPKNVGKSNQYGRAHAWLKAHLTPEQFAAANRSIQDAHYTSDKVVAMMWRAARHFGFKGGRALEPTVGTGNFLGLAPTDLAGATEWHAAELDDVSGRIAQLLYPEANILAATGFQDAPFADGVMDLAIGNPPFGQQPIRDRSKRRGHLDGMKIHNYIIAKAGMHLRPGGVMQMVVTHRFLDTADAEGRRELAKHFRLLGAVRLPNDAFKATAGTEVTTDMVYLQKLREGEAPDTGAAWLDTHGEIEVDGVTMRVNRYFQDNPQNILGKSSLAGSMYQGQGKEYTVESDGRDIAADFDTILTEGSLAGLADVMAQTDIDRDGQAVMLERSDLPVGGMTLTPEGTIIQRDLDDAAGNSVINEITPESYWKDQAAQWGDAIDAMKAIKAAREDSRPVSPGLLNALEEAAQVATTASGGRKPKPTKAEQAIYDVMDAAVNPQMPWTFDAGLAAMEATLERKRLGRKGYDTLRKLLDLRNKTHELIIAERTNSPSMETRRQALDKSYDAFVKAYGVISAPNNLSLLAGDVGVEVGLETHYQPEIKKAEAAEMGVEPRKASADKADILTRRVAWPDKVIERADNPLDGMSISMSEKGRLDLAYIAGLVKAPQEQVTRELLDAEAIFYDPDQRDFVTADEYLSGNVKHKLQVAQAQGQDSNVAALEKVQPEPKTQDRITPSMRGTWLPTSVFEDFLASLGLKKPKVLVLPEIGRISARESVGEPSDLGLQFSDPDVSMVQLFNAAASGKSLKVTRKDRDGNSYEDKAASQRVTAKAERMAQVFMEWAYSDPDRAQVVVDAYNRTMNTHRQRTFNGEKYLKTVGQSPSVTLRRTQKNAAWRMIQSNAVLTDHVVGSGKTMTLITGIMERRRLGLSRKPAIVVPNHLVVQWASEFYQLYPGARLLAATPDDFSKKNRRRLFARIATGDYDAIIMGHTSFGFIEAPEADVRAVIAENKAKLQTAMEEAKANGESGRTLKQMQKKLDTYDDRLRALAERPRDEMGVDFEAMGIDYLAVDEAHMFKNLEYATSGERVVGMNDPKGSGRAFDLYTKLRGLQRRGGGVTFATGTPVSNSLVELYTMMRYLAPDSLKARDQDHFDAWAGAYAVTETRMEYTATQKLKPRRVLSGLANLDGLGQLYREFADIVTMADLKRIYSEEKRESNAATGATERTEFPVPKVKHGGRYLDTGEITDQQSEYMDYLVARMQAIEEHKRDPEYKRIDNPLWVLGDARKMSLDVRVVDPTARRDENGKVMRSARKIKDLYDRWDADKGAQMVFSDMSTPAKTSGAAARKIVGDGLKVVFGEAEGKRVKKRLKDMSMAEQWKYVQRAAEQVMEDPAITPAKVEAIEAYLEQHVFADTTMLVADTGFSVYDDLKTVLTEMGIPSHEIAFIHDYNTPEQKARLFSRVNNGAIRVLIGSTEKMGAGTNAQERLVGLHHLDAPWRPSDVEQREGRIIRQGNTLYKRDPDGFEVEITAYSTNGTSDTVMWQVLERKAAAIEQFRQAGIDTMQEEGADSDQYAEFMAASTGNPVFRLKLEAERDLTNIQAEVGGKLIAVQNARAFMEHYPERTEGLRERIAGLEAMAPGDIVMGDQTGSLEGMKEVWDAAQAKFLEDHAKWDAEYDRIAAEREALRAEGKKKLPALPAAPAEPTLMDTSILEKSAYARTIQAALEEATKGNMGDSRLVPVRIGNAELEIERRPHPSGNRVTYAVYLTLPGKLRTNLAVSEAKNPVDAPSLVNALTPRTLKTAIEAELRSARRGLEDLQARLEREQGLAREEVSETPITEAQTLLDWYKDQVKIAEYAADLKRGERQNRYIAADRTRPLGQFKARGEVQAKTFTVNGETFTTTGLAAVEGHAAGSRTLHDATRDRDGAKALVYEQRDRQDAEPILSAVLEPAEAKKQRRSATAQSNARRRPRATRMSVAEVGQRLRQGRHGAAVGRLLDSGKVQITDVVPRDVPNSTAAYVDEQGIIHLVARNLDPRHVEATLLHEAFHAGARPLIGSRRWNELMDRLGKLYHQAERSSGRNRRFWEAAHARIAAAEAAGDVMSETRVIEEFGAYAIEEFASAPRTLRQWASELVGRVKAWLLRTFGIQAGELTPAQLRALAAAALRNGEMAPSPALGPQVAPDTPAFQRWFGDSKVVDSTGRPKVMYHGTFGDFGEFQPSSQASGLIFFTDQIGIAEQYASAQRAGYSETARQMSLSEVGVLADEYPSQFEGMHLRRDVGRDDFIQMTRFWEVPYPIATLPDRLEAGEIGLDEAVSLFNDAVDALLSGGSLMPVYLKAERPYGHRTMPLHWRVAEDMGADRLRAEGYDSVWVTEGEGAAIAVLDSSQVKSLYNRGTFDPASPDIAKSVGEGALVDRDGNPVPERERKAEVGKAVRSARKALSVVQQDGVNDRDGGVVRDILPVTALLTQPYTIASMEPAFTPVFRTGMAQMRFRDTLIAEMYPRFQTYKALRADSRAKVNKVLELGRLSGLSFSDSRLRTGVQNRGYKTVVSHDPTGLPMRRQEPLHAALTRPGEVTTLTQEEIAAYQELRTMFDEALDLFRDQTLIDMDMADFVGRQDPVGDILAAISGDMNDATKERYQNIAKMVEEIDQAKRTGYVPLARYGRFAITVREKIAKVTYAKNPDGGYIARGVPDTLADFMREIGASWNDLEDGWQVSEGQRRQLSRETTRTVYSEKLDPESYAHRWETWRASKNGKRPDQLSFIKAARARIEAEWGGEGRRISVLDTKRARLEGGLKLSDIDSLADMAQVDPATWENIRDDFVKAMKGRGFRKHFFRADHVPGYELDFERAIADYIAGMAGYLSRRHHDKQWETAIGQVRGPHLSAYSREYRDYLNNPAEEWAVLRQTGFLFYIAGNVSTALLNATQVPIMTLPALSQVMSHAKAVKHVTGAYKDALAMTSLYDQAREGYTRGGVAGAADSMLQMFDPEDAPADVRAEVRAAWEDGMFSPQFTHEVMGFSNRRDGSPQAKLEKTIDYVAASYTYIERLNRLVTFIAAVRAAKDPRVQARAQTALKGNHLARATLLDDNWSPKAFGEFIVDESQFLMGKVNRAKILRSHGAAVFQFMSFVINSLQAWYRWSAVNGRDGKFATAYSLAAIVALSGVWGAPGMEYLRKGIEQLWLTLTGEDEDLRYNLRQWVGEQTGQDWLGEIVDKGSFYPLGADMSGRIGFMRMLPDMSTPIAMGGIPADLLIGRPSRAAKAALQGNYGGAVAELAPNFLKNPITAHQWSRKGVVSRAGNQAVTPEQIPPHAYWYKALGIQPSIVSDAWEYKFATSRLKRSTSDAKTRLVNKLARAEADAARNADPARQPEFEARIERLYQDVDAFNDANPDQWLDPRTLNRRVFHKLNEYLYGFDQLGPVPSPDVERAREVYNIDDMTERGRQGGP